MTQRAPISTRIEPRGWPIELLTWAHAQVAIPPAPFIQAKYDWPNPQFPLWHRPNLELRTWIQTPQTGNIPPPPAFNKYDWPNPPPLPPNLELRTWVQRISEQAEALTLPLAQYDWPVPRGLIPSVELLTWIEGTQQIEVAAALPQRQHDFPNPVLATPPVVDLKTWSQGLPPGQMAFGAATPPYAFNWTVPPTQQRPEDLLSWAQGAVQAGPFQEPFIQTDWPNPVLPIFSMGLRTWIQSAAVPPVVQLPFNPYDFPNPQVRPTNYELLRSFSGIPETALSLSIPPLNYDFPNPVIARISYDLRSWFQSPIPPPFVQLPFSQYDWPNPQPLPPNLVLRTILPSLSIVLFPPPLGATIVQVRRRHVWVVPDQ